ncbi:MFS general substrate transporter [Nemania sp. NC0429]|nr:MFS general substrate transporter [Nemania sp. NC0429]
MVHVTNTAAAAATTMTSTATTTPADSFPARSRPPIGTTKPGSFRAGSPLPVLSSNRSRLPSSLRRLSSHHDHYQTFPTPAPRSAGRRPSAESDNDENGSPDSHDASTPLPIRQLALLAVLSLAEQSALNSISPYLPEMVGSFPGMNRDQVGLYVGLLASAFAFAQLATNLFWGYLSDIVGRKPVMLAGTSLLCVCFILFGFCTRYYQIILVHVAMGLLNGNAAVVPSCLGELTDRSNQSKAFTWLPVVYSIGSITGPALGGLLVAKLARDQYPFLAPNLVAAALLALSVAVLAIWFEETLEDREEYPDWAEKFPWLHRLLKKNDKVSENSWTWPGGRDTDGADDERSEQDESEAGENTELLRPPLDESDDEDTEPSSDAVAWRQLINRTTVVLLATSLIFQLTNSSFNSLYPVFASGKEPTGRNLHADVIGVALSVAGIFTIFFQLFLFRSLKGRLGNVGTYRGALLGFAVTMALMPFVGYVDSQPPFGLGNSRIWLYVELGIVLVIKNICAVGGLSCVMLLITNSAPSHASLGTLNGVAQTLSAAGRSVGPFLSGAMFTASTHVHPKGEGLAWGLFAGIALIGWLATYAIHGHGLESTDDGFEDEEGEEHDHADMRSP